MTAFNISVDQANPGVLGFLVVAGIGFALYLLIKSMNKQISKIEVPREADIAREEREKRQQPANHGAGDGPSKSGKSRKPDEPGTRD